MRRLLKSKRRSRRDTSSILHSHVHAFNMDIWFGSFAALLMPDFRNTVLFLEKEMFIIQHALLVAVSNLAAWVPHRRMW